MHFITGIGFLLCVIQLATCSYGPWEDIKKFYNDATFFYWDEAETRQAELEKSCLELNNGEETICYEDCILRQHYGMLSLMEMGHLGVATFELARKLEDTVLKVQDDNYPDRQNIGELYKPCQEETPSFDFHQFVKGKTHYLEETERMVCLLLPDAEKAMLSKMVECVKQKIKQ